MGALRQPDPDPEQPQLLLLINNEAAPPQTALWVPFAWRLLLGAAILFGLANVFHGIAR